MEVNGFASIHKENFNWNQNGLNIIQAPNGYGKSKFIDALSWCLYGKSLSGSIEPWPHKRHKKYKGTRVKVIFASELGNHEVIRCKDFKGDVLGAKGNNRLIFRTGGEATDEKKKEKIQLEIQESLGYSFDLFKNSIIFGQKIKRLITETGPNKKKIFEEAFEMSYIPQAKAMVEKEKKTIELTYYKQKSKVEGLQEKLEDKKEALESELKMVNSFEDDKDTEIIEITKEYKKVMKKYKKLKSPKENEVEIADYLEVKEKELKKLDEGKLNKKSGKLEAEIERLTNEGVSITSDITNLEDSLDLLPEACSNCGKKFTKKEQQIEHKKIKDEVLFLRQDYTKLVDLLSNTRGQIKKLNSTISSITSIKESIILYKEKSEILEAKDNLSTQGESLNGKIEKIKQKSLKNSTKKYTRDIKRIKKALKPEKKLLKKLKKDLEIKNWLINDPLSNNGLKAFIFNKMLDKLNEKLSYYSKFIPFKVLFDLDMDSHHKNIDTYVMDGDSPVPFEDLSGGQQQAVNIVTAFSIHDVVSEGKDCNLLIMDELFESLDKDNIEIMSELIQDKSKNKALFLITHRAEFNPTNANFIYIHYKNGFSSVA